MPVFEFSSVKTDDPTNKSVDVVVPVQSYFCGVTGAIESVTSDASITDFLELEPIFGRKALGDTYDPWIGLDYIGQTEIWKKLNPSVNSKVLSKTGVPSGTSSQHKPYSTPRDMSRPYDCWVSLMLLNRPRIYVSGAVKTFCTSCTFCRLFVFVLYVVFFFCCIQKMFV